MWTVDSPALFYLDKKQGQHLLYYCFLLDRLVCVSVEEIELVNIEIVFISSQNWTINAGIHKPTFYYIRIYRKIYYYFYLFGRVFCSCLLKRRMIFNLIVKNFRY